MPYHASTMQHHVQAQAAGTLSVSGYCRRHDLKVSTFYYWKKKLVGAAPPEPPAAAHGFTQLRPHFRPIRAASPATCHLRLPSGWQVELTGVAIEDLAALLHAIEAGHA